MPSLLAVVSEVPVFRYQVSIETSLKITLRMAPVRASTWNWLPIQSCSVTIHFTTCSSISTVAGFSSPHFPTGNSSYALYQVSREVSFQEYLQKHDNHQDRAGRRLISTRL